MIAEAELRRASGLPRVLALRMMRRHGEVWDPDELEAAGVHGLAKAWATYDPKRGRSFTSHAYQVVGQEISRYQQHEVRRGDSTQRARQRLRASLVSLDDRVCEGRLRLGDVAVAFPLWGSAPPDPEKAPLERELLDSLPDAREREFCRQWLVEGWLRPEQAEYWGITVSSVLNWRTRQRERLQAWWREEEEDAT